MTLRYRPDPHPTSSPRSASCTESSQHAPSDRSWPSPLQPYSPEPWRSVRREARKSGIPLRSLQHCTTSSPTYRPTSWRRASGGSRASAPGTRCPIRCPRPGASEPRGAGSRPGSTRFPPPAAGVSMSPTRPLSWAAPSESRTRRRWSTCWRFSEGRPTPGGTWSCRATSTHGLRTRWTGRPTLPAQTTTRRGWRGCWRRHGFSRGTASTGRSSTWGCRVRNRACSEGGIWPRWRLRRAGASKRSSTTT